MVLCWVNGVHSDDVGVNLLQVWNVALASIAIRQWVSVGSVGAGGAVGRVILLVRNTLEVAEALLALHSVIFRSSGVQLRSVVCVEEVLSVDLDVRNVVVAGRRNTAQQRRSDGPEACKSAGKLHDATKTSDGKLSNEG